MFNGLFNSIPEQAIERGLDAASLRERLIANNIANADTPNYKAQRLRFEDILANELNQSQSGELQLTRTNPLHLPGRGLGDIGGTQTSLGTIYTDNSSTFRLDGNNVDIDAETAEEAKNALQYSMLTELASRRMATLRSVFTEGRV